jgi:signal transduction histidine kinase
VLAPCPLRPLVEEVVSITPKGRVEVRNEVPEDLPVPDLDRDQVREVLITLVQNAVEALPTGGGEVMVGAEGGTDQPWRIFVRDNGPGIPPEVAGRIFDPLFSTSAKGSGLRLAIAANVVTRHHGRIAVESTPGKGTMFVIEIPAGDVRQAA